MKTFAISLCVSIATIFAPIKGALATVLILCLADLVFGVIAARKRGESITSAGIGRTVVKLCVFEVSILLAFLAEKYLALSTVIPAVNILSALVATTELLSVYENLNSISGQKLLASIISKLGSVNDDKRS